MTLKSRKEQPWDRAGITKEAWRALLHEVGKAYLPHANAELRRTASERRSALAPGLLQDLRDTLDGNTARIKTLLSLYVIEQADRAHAPERRVA